MFTPRKQRTLAGTAVVEGFGYWSSRDVRLEFRPAPVDTGIVFVRKDLDGSPRIPADVAHRVEVPRRTTLQCGEARVDMVEHVMAALAGLQIDNCEVWTNEPEMPGCDGSSEAVRASPERRGNRTPVRGSAHTDRRSSDPPGRRDRVGSKPGLPSALAKWSSTIWTTARSLRSPLRASR